MNKANILRVADAIEQHSIPDLGFNMGSWVDKKASGTDDKSGHNCGTTACIAGWAAAVNGGDVTKLAPPDIRIQATEFLELTSGQALWLFEGFRGDPEPTQAVAVLRHLAETGKVDWLTTGPKAA